MTDTTKERAQWINVSAASLEITQRLMATSSFADIEKVFTERGLADVVEAIILKHRAEQSTETPPRIQRFWDAQAEWSQATFGTDAERDHIGPLKHLEKEAVEAQTRPADYVEIADCLFLVFDAARRSGMTLEMLIEIADKKLVVNKARKWSKPTSDAPVEHVRVAEAPRPVGTPEKENL